MRASTACTVLSGMYSIVLEVPGLVYQRLHLSAGLKLWRRRWHVGVVHPDQVPAKPTVGPGKRAQWKQLLVRRQVPYCRGGLLIASKSADWAIQGMTGRQDSKYSGWRALIDKARAE